MEAKGSLFRGYLARLAAEDLLDEVKARVPRETAQLMEHPPLVSSWIDVAHQDALLGVYAELRGLDACSAMGHAVARDSLSAFLKPVLSAILAISGASPHAIYARLDSISQNSVRPVKFTYDKTGERAGRITLRAPQTLTEARLYVWRGSFRYAFDLCRVQGTVDRPVPREELRGATFDVRWE